MTSTKKPDAVRAAAAELESRTPKRKRAKSTAPRAPRTIDPRAAASAWLLSTILDRWLAKLTESDKEKLLYHLKQIVECG